MSKKTHNIQRVELASYDIPLHCPFCGARAFDPDPEKQAKLKPCQHTLFMAHDEGFEYLSDRAAAILGVTSIDEAMEREESIDEMTDLIKVPDSVKFAAYVGPPGGFGDYVGFATLDDE